MEQWEHRVVVLVPGDLCNDHRPGEDSALWPLPPLVVGRERGEERERSAATARRVHTLEDQIDLWVRNLSRSLLVERVGGLAVSGELTLPSLPSLAVLQGLAERCGLTGELLARGVSHHSGQIVALFSSRTSGGLGLRRAPSLSKLPRSRSRSKLVQESPRSRSKHDSPRMTRSRSNASLVDRDLL